MSQGWVARLLAGLERGASLQDVARSAWFSAMLAKVAGTLSRTGVTPNSLTLFSLVPAIASGIAAAYGALQIDPQAFMAHATEAGEHDRGGYQGEDRGGREEDDD